MFTVDVYSTYGGERGWKYKENNSMLEENVDLDYAQNLSTRSVTQGRIQLPERNYAKPDVVVQTRKDVAMPVKLQAQQIHTTHSSNPRHIPPDHYLTISFCRQNIGRQILSKPISNENESLT